MAEAVIWPRKETVCDVNSNYFSLPPPSSQPSTSPTPSSLPPYVSHLTVKELPSWTTPRHQRSSSVSSSSTGSLGSSAFPPHQNKPKTSIGFASDRAGTPHNNAYRVQETHRSDFTIFVDICPQIEQQQLQLQFKSSADPSIPDPPLSWVGFPQTWDWNQEQRA